MTDSDRGWRDRIVGERMRVDQEFNDRVRASSLSSQQWSLVMTAIEFEVEGEGETARLVADTSKLDAVAEEIDRIGEQAPGGSGGSSGGLMDSIKSTLGVSGGADDELLREARDLADEYAEALQERLESTGRWEEVREAAQPSPE